VSGKHVHVCQACGAERRSHKRLDSPCAPKLCAKCQRNVERVRLALMFRRPVLTELDDRGHA
jgi:hypothetical protein